MNQILNYINENYKNKLVNFKFVHKDKLWQLKKNDYIKLIKINDLKYINAGKIVKIEKNWNYIKVYNYFTKKYKIIYPKDHYIYFKKYLNKNDLFRQSLEEIFNKI